MGHITLKNPYGALVTRLQGNPVGAPDTPVLRELLSLLFSRQEAEVAAQMPYAFVSTGKLARKTGVERRELEDLLDDMAEKGLVFDLTHNGRSWWYLNPLVIGFFEFTMMRVRPEIDQKLVARKMHEYAFESPGDAFVKELGAGDTQLFRPLVHEDGLDEAVVEVLDWERASAIVRDAKAWTVGLCHCRHVAEHNGKPCKYPMEMCLSLNRGAEYLARRHMAKAISRDEALSILAEARRLGLVQLGDNVQRGITFICNCCSCCCGLLEGYRRLKDTGKLHTSNYLARVKPEQCNGCRACVKACAVQAIATVEEEGKATGVKVDEGVCIGCGVCATRCKHHAMSMVSRPFRVHTPETTVERVVTMALERGKLQNLLFDDPTSITHSALRLFLKAILTMPPTRRLMAAGQLKSRFVHSFLKLADFKPNLPRIEL